MGRRARPHKKIIAQRYHNWVEDAHTHSLWFTILLSGRKRIGKRRITLHTVRKKKKENEQEEATDHRLLEPFEREHDWT